MNEFIDNNKSKIRETNDPLSKLGVYLSLNPNLSKPEYDRDQFEIDRIRVTRYRVGSHNLKIETGRMYQPIIPREDRLCDCMRDIQSLTHILFNCPLLQEIYNRHNMNTTDLNIEETFKSPTIATILLEIEKILKLWLFIVSD